MIELPRGVARDFRAVLRKCTSRGRAREPCPFVLCRAGEEGLTLTCESGGVTLRLTLEGERREGVIAFPATVLADLEGGGREAVRLRRSAPMKGEATWGEGELRRGLEFDAPDVREPDFPDPEMHDPGGGFLAALAEAARTAGRDAGRYALRCVLLRGASGEVIASDGRQLLAQRGFTLPWKDDALVPALPALGARELVRARTALVGRTGGRVVLNCGPWSLALREEDPRHYPDVGRVLALGERLTTLTLDLYDARRLAEALPSLPGADEEFRPVTLHLSRTPGVSAGDASLTLEASRCKGEAVSLRTDRRYLLRAVALGFRELSTRPGAPLIATDARRAYAWMPLDTPPGDTPVERRGATMDAREGNGRHGDDKLPEPADPLAEAEALREQLQQALARTTRLIASLRQQRRQERAVKSAVASLRKLRDL